MQELCPRGAGCVTLLAVGMCKPRSSEPVTFRGGFSTRTRRPSAQPAALGLLATTPPRVMSLGPQTLLSPRKVQGPEEPRVRSRVRDQQLGQKVPLATLTLGTAQASGGPYQDAGRE